MQCIRKKKGREKNIYYVLDKNHPKECISLNTNKIKEDTNLISNYNDFLNKCFKYLDSTEIYNKKGEKINQNIYR